MSRGSKTSTAGPEAVVRLAWIVTYVIPLVLAALLLVAGSSNASPAPAADPLAFEDEVESESEVEEEGEAAEGECAEAEEEFEEGELSAAEVDEYCEEELSRDRLKGKRTGKGSSAPEECLLRSAHGRAVTDDAHDKLKLTLGYTTYEPVAATIEVKGGATRIGSIHRHLGRSGVLRIVKSLHGDAPPKRLHVRLRIAASPGYCGKFQTQKIRVS